MQTAFTANKISIPARSFAPKASRTAGRHQVQVQALHRVNSDEESTNPLQSAIAAGLSMILIAGNAAPALAATKAAPASTQGNQLEELLAQQKEGKVKAITIRSTTAPAPTAGKATKPAPKPKAAAPNPKPAAPKPVAKPAAAKKAAPAPKKAAPAAKPVAAKPAPLKFDKVSTGVQGAAPEGVALPVPKGAVKAAAKPAPAVKKAAPKPAAKAKPAATKKAAEPKAVVEAVKAPEPKPVAAKKTAAAKTVAAAKKAPETKPVVAAAKTAAKVGAAAGAAKLATSVAAPAPKASSSSSSSGFSFGDGAVQAGAVVAAEAVGLAVASAVVGGLTAAPRAPKANRA